MTQVSRQAPMIFRKKRRQGLFIGRNQAYKIPYTWQFIWAVLSMTYNIKQNRKKEDKPWALQTPWNIDGYPGDDD